MRERRLLSLLVIVAGIWVLVVPAWAAEERAVVELRDSQGQLVGIAILAQEEAGVRIGVVVKNLSPGLHGIHLHAAGTCEPPDFSSAGPHFNPLGKKHGLDNPQGPHAGDLPNLAVGPDGTGILDIITERVTLKAGPLSLFDADGSALVIHAGPDDQQSDPAGNSGGRIACGIILPRVEPGPGDGRPTLLLLILVVLTALLLLFLGVLR